MGEDDQLKLNLLGSPLNKNSDQCLHRVMVMCQGANGIQCSTRRE